MGPGKIQVSQPWGRFRPQKRVFRQNPSRKMHFSSKPSSENTIREKTLKIINLGRNRSDFRNPCEKSILKMGFSWFLVNVRTSRSSEHVKKKMFLGQHIFSIFWENHKITFSDQKCHCVCADSRAKRPLRHETTEISIKPPLTKPIASRAAQHLCKNHLSRIFDGAVLLCCAAVLLCWSHTRSKSRASRGKKHDCWSVRKYKA